MMRDRHNDDVDVEDGAVTGARDCVTKSIGTHKIVCSHQWRRRSANCISPTLQSLWYSVVME